VRWLFGVMLLAACGLAWYRSIQPYPEVHFRAGIQNSRGQRFFAVQHVDGSFEEYGCDSAGRVVAFQSTFPGVTQEQVQAGFERLLVELRRQGIVAEGDPSHFRRHLANLPRDWPRVIDQSSPGPSP
jgi:hypothetical protein